MIKVYPSKLSGTINPPPSKSVTHRALILAGMCQAGSTITNKLDGEDTNATQAVLERMGMLFKEFSTNRLYVSNVIQHGAGMADCKNSGTTIRLLTAVHGNLTEKTTLTGDSSLLTRPMQDLTQSLRNIGIEIEDTDGKPPVTISGKRREGNQIIDIEGNKSSQFISGLALYAAMRPNKSVTSIRILNKLSSKPYLDLTLKMLEEIGTDISWSDDRTLKVISRYPYMKHDFYVPPDASSAAFFLGAGVLRDNKVTVEGNFSRYHQADYQLIEILQQLGVNLEFENYKIIITGSKLIGADIDLSNAPDLFPIVCVIASFAEGKSHIYGASHLKYKETNRIKTTAALIKGIGGMIEEKEDGAIITGQKTLKGGTEIDSFGDHRIAMAAAIAGTATDEPVTIIDEECVAVSYRDFFMDLQHIGGKVEEV